MIDPQAVSGVTQHNEHQPTTLRRADWRFLLPRPPEGSFRHLVLLGGPPGLRERLIEVGFARRVSTSIPADRSADAVVVLYDAQVALDEAIACLVPQGMFYCEIDRRSAATFALTPRRMQRSLKALGLSTIGLYWVAPNFTACKRYIPLDTSGALRWYFDTLYYPGTFTDHLLERGVRLYTKLEGSRFALVAPCYCVTAVVDPATNDVPSIFGHAGLPSNLKAAGTRPVLLTSGQDDASRVIMVPFGQENTEPWAVIKISRLPEFNINTEREQSILEEVRLRLHPPMRDTIPIPYGILQYDNLKVAVESFTPGHSLSVSSGRWRTSFQHQRSDLHLAAEWLRRFHLETQVRHNQRSDAQITCWVNELLFSYEQMFGQTVSEERLFVLAREQASMLEGSFLPVVWMHYDFGPWNLYRARDNFFVIDWEFGRDWERGRFGPALCDLLYFVTYWMHIVGHLYTEEDELRGLYDLFIKRDPEDETTAEVHRVIDEYMRALNIDRRFLPVLLVYTWVEQALHRSQRKQLLGQVEDTLRANNRVVKYIGVLAEHAVALFDTPS